MAVRRRGGYFWGMERGAYIIAVQKAGWALFSSNAEGLTFQCSHPACRSAIFTPERMIERAELPGPCEREHGEGQGIPVTSYQDLMRVFADTRRRLGIDQEEAAAACGLTSGHCNKLEAGHRQATWPVLFSLAATLGLRLEIARAPVPRQTAAIVEYRMASPMKRRWRLIPTRRLGEEAA